MTSKSCLLRASLVLAPFAAACSDPSSPVAPAESPVLQVPRAVASSNAPIPDEYIVVFDDSEVDPVGRARALVAQQQGELKHTYQHALKGFSARMSPQAAAALARAPGIKRVEADVAMHATETVVPISWGLDRIDQTALPLNSSFTFNSSGSGVRVYIVDTGIRTSHAEFGGRAISGYTAISDGNGSNDCNGHGTHVAGTVGGSTAGVARSAQLVAVRVLDCSGSGSSSGVIAGIDYVTSQKNANRSIPMVANLSLGGGANQSLDDAVAKSVAAGVVFAVAGGNSATDACTQSPARAASALTVGATESNDARAGYSNYGSCLDIFAPGSGITSAWHTADDAFAGLSGTSMASPHVAGVAAVILGDYPTSTPEQVRATLLSASATGVVSDAGAGSSNALLTNLYSAPATVPPPAPTPTPPPAPVSISLTVTKSRSGKNNNANLAWSGATASTVSVYRNGAFRTTTTNDGVLSDPKLSAGSYTYKVCQADVCSPSVTVTF